jgi:hypothetical protein
VSRLSPLLRNPAALVGGLGALLLFFQWVAARPLWLDEEMIAINLRERSVRQLASPLLLGQSAPYGWLVLQRAVLLALGSSELALRVVPVLFGMATLAAAVWTGRRWMRPAGAVVLVLFCALGQWIAHYAVEVKHYSADVFFALLLPALAVRAVETNRFLTWWAVAAIGQWFANAAVFVTPAAALVMGAIVVRRAGAAAAVGALVPGVAWLVLFALNYTLLLQPAQASRFLQNAWAFALPPAGADLTATVHWLIEQLAPSADKPGGSSFGVTLWLVATAGWALAAGERRALGLVFALVPVTAWILAGLGVVPYFERLILWVVPAVGVGVALLADAGARWRGLGAIAAAVVIVPISLDVGWRGFSRLIVPPGNENHLLDDRGSMRWLAGQQAPGDVWVTTHYGMPAIWWYGPGFSAPVLKVAATGRGLECDPRDLRRALQGSSRALVYLGFRFDDVPRGFDDLLLSRLVELGSVTAYRIMSTASVAAIVDFSRPPSRPDPTAPVRSFADPAALAPKLDACLTVQKGRRW